MADWLIDAAYVVMGEGRSPSQVTPPDGCFATLVSLLPGTLTTHPVTGTENHGQNNEALKHVNPSQISGRLLSGGTQKTVNADLPEIADAIKESFSTIGVGNHVCEHHSQYDEYQEVKEILYYNAPLVQRHGL